MVPVGTVLENMKKGTSYSTKPYFEFKIKLAIYNLIYLAVRNIRHILTTTESYQIVIVNDKLHNIWTIFVIQFYS